MKKRDIIKLVKETIAKRRKKFYGQHDYYGNNVGGRNSISGMPGVWEEENLDEEGASWGLEIRQIADSFTFDELEQLYKDNKISKEDLTGAKGYLQAWIDQHPTYLPQRDLNTSKRQAIRSYYLDPDRTTPKGGTQSSQFEEGKGTFISKDGEVSDFDNEKYKPPKLPPGIAPGGHIKKEQDMAPKAMAGRIKDVFDMVNGTKHPVQTPEFWKNFFKSRYGIPFPENLKNITTKQALSMNKFGNDMKKHIKEATVVSKMTNPSDAADLAKSTGTTPDAVKAAIDTAKKTGEEVTVAEDDEGRMAKSQMYKMKGYVDKLSQMLDDGAQLPAWVQAKVTKASSMMSAVFHYLDYEAVRGQDNLMENMDKYKKRTQLMEGATEKLFKLFNAGKTDADVRAHYLQMNVDMPESFISKLRKNWEDLRKTKLDLTLADKEAEGFNKIQEPGAESGEVGMEPSVEPKQLASGLKI